MIYKCTFNKKELSLKFKMKYVPCRHNSSKARHGLTKSSEIYKVAKEKLPPIYLGKENSFYCVDCIAIL